MTAASATTALLQRMATVEQTTDERFDEEDLNREEARVMDILVSRGLATKVSHKETFGDFVFCSYRLTTLGKEFAATAWY